jgi:hypothetical protein
MATIFISCGQYTTDEKGLGKQVCDIVRTFKYDPYFAENQSSLNGLHENILAKLYECAGFITIMHPRGEVKYSNNIKHIRGSVWVEQEIAIAAFMAHCLGRNIEVAAFIHEDIKREGIRDLLHLNPVSFKSSDEILERLPAILSKWQLASPRVKLQILYKKAKITGERHDYQLEVSVVNGGPTRIEEYQLDVQFPNAFLEQSTMYTTEVRERRSATHRWFRMTERNRPGEPLFPGDIKRLFILDYFVDNNVFHDQRAMAERFTVSFRSGKEQPTSETLPVRDFQIF